MPPTPILLRDYQQVAAQSLTGWGTSTGSTNPYTVVTSALANPSPGYAILGVYRHLAPIRVGFLELAIDIDTATITNHKLTEVYNASPGLVGSIDFHLFNEDNVIIANIPNHGNDNAVTTRHGRFAYGTTFGSLQATSPWVTASQTGTSAGRVEFLSPEKFLLHYFPNSSGSGLNTLYTLHVREGLVGSSTLGSVIQHRGYQYDPNASSSSSSDDGFGGAVVMRSDVRDIGTYLAGFRVGGVHRWVQGSITATGSITSFSDLPGAEDPVPGGDTVGLSLFQSFHTVFQGLEGRGALRPNMGVSPSANDGTISLEAVQDQFVEIPLMRSGSTINHRFARGRTTSLSLMEGVSNDYRFTPYNDPLWCRWDLTTGLVAKSWISTYESWPLCLVSENPPVLLSMSYSNSPGMSAGTFRVAGLPPARTLPSGQDNSADEAPKNPHARLRGEKVMRDG